MIIINALYGPVVGLVNIILGHIKVHKLYIKDTNHVPKNAPGTFICGLWFRVEKNVSSGTFVDLTHLRRVSADGFLTAYSTKARLATT